jgi:hypothetical protein
MTDRHTITLTALPTMEETGVDKGKVLIHGEPGTGKTTLASSIALLGKTLYIYFPGEQGISSIPAEYRKNLVPLLIKDVDRLNSVLWDLQLGEHDFEAVVIEGIAAWQNLYVRYVQDLPQDAPRPKSKRQKQTDWRRVGGDVGGFLKDDLIFWYGLADYTQARPIHVVMTSQTKHRQIREKTDDNNEVGELLDEYVGPDVFPGIANAVEATPDFIGYTFIEDEGMGEEDYVFKVRFGPHDLIRTKVHEDVTAKRKWPAVVGKQGQRLTLPRFLKHHGKA